MERKQIDLSPGSGRTAKFEATVKTSSSWSELDVLQKVIGVGLIATGGLVLVAIAAAATYVIVEVGRHLF